MLTPSCVYKFACASVETSFTFDRLIYQPVFVSAKKKPLNTRPSVDTFWILDIQRTPSELLSISEILAGFKSCPHATVLLEKGVQGEVFSRFGFQQLRVDTTTANISIAYVRAERVPL